MFVPVSSNRKFQTLLFGFTSFNPADLTSYFFGSYNTTPSSVTNVIRRIQSSINGYAYAYSFKASYSAGTSEQSVVKLNNKTKGTTINLFSNLVFDSNFLTYSGGIIPFIVSIGDELEIEIVTPTWVTNPTGLVCTCHIHFTE